MQLLVTGGAGFIGSHFLRSILSGRYPAVCCAELTVLDKLTYAGSWDNLAPVADDARLRLVHGDICDTDLVNSVLRGHEAVVHWSELARAGYRLAGLDPGRVRPVGIAELPRAAARPACSVLAHRRWAACGIAEQPHWHDQLAAFFREA